VWPFDRKRDVLRVGRLSVELWRSQPEGLVRAHAVAIGSRDDLSAGLKALLETQSESRTSLDVVVESAWLPVVLLETGHEVWAQDAVEGLLRYRLARVYDERDDAVASWELRFDHQPGERFGVGYGLSPRVRAAVDEACAEVGFTVASLQPALQWGMRRSSPQSGWFVWLEHDRAIVAFLEKGQVTAMQPAAELPGNPAHLTKMLRLEQLRAGIGSAPVSVALAGWDAPSSLQAAAGVNWHGVAAGPGVLTTTVPAGTAA